FWRAGLRYSPYCPWATSEQLPRTKSKRRNSMKTRWGTCVFILPALLTGTLLLSAAGQPANAIIFGQAPSVPGSSSLLQANPPAPTEPAQAANGQGITGEGQGRIAKKHMVVKVGRGDGGDLVGRVADVGTGK